MSHKGRLLLGISLILLIILGGLYFAIQVWMPFMWVVLGSSLVTLFAGIVLDRKILLDFLNMKTTKHGLSLGFLVLIMMVFLVSFNFLAVKKNSSFDYSVSGQFTISPQSVQIVQTLNSPLEFKFFYKAGSENIESSKKSFSQVVDLFKGVSKNVTAEFIEMNENPKLAAEFSANKGIGEAFVKYNDQKIRIESQFMGQQGQKYNEQEVTNAIIKATRKEKKNIYFTEGHGEKEFEDEKNEKGIYSFKQLLEKNSYQVKKINFVTQTTVPADAHVIVIAAPEQAFQKFEIALLINYLKQGGSLFISLDNQNTAGLDDLLKEFGLKLNKNYIFNILKTPMGQVVNSAEATVAVDYSPISPITKMFSANYTSIFIRPNSLDQLSVPTLVKTEPIIKTPEASVALKNLTSDTYEGQPQAFVIAAESSGQIDNQSKKFKAVIFADGDFIANTTLTQNANRDISLNSIAFLTEETDLISIAAKTVGLTTMKMNPVEFTQFFKFMVIGLFLPIPFVFLIIGIILWMKRRHA